MKILIVLISAFFSISVFAEDPFAGDWRGRGEQRISGRPPIPVIIDFNSLGDDFIVTFTYPSNNNFREIYRVVFEGNHDNDPAFAKYMLTLPSGTDVKMSSVCQPGVCTWKATTEVGLESVVVRSAIDENSFRLFQILIQGDGRAVAYYDVVLHRQ